MSCEDLVQLTLIVSNKFIFIVIFIENFNLYDLVALKFVVDVENFVKVRVEFISLGLGFPESIPLLIFLSFEIDDAEWVTFVIDTINVDQAAARYCELHFVWTFYAVQRFRIFFNVVITHLLCDVLKYLHVLPFTLFLLF